MSACTPPTPLFSANRTAEAPLEAFIVGVALCSTSLGTTLVVINSASASRALDFSQTRIGTVLLSAAVLDDVCGLVLVSVVRGLRDLDANKAGLGWVIGRPILASGLMAVLAPLIAYFVFAPVARTNAVRNRLGKHGHMFNIVVMVLVLCAFLAVAAYAGASVLFGSFLAGVFLSLLGWGAGAEEGIVAAAGGMSPLFPNTLEKYIADVQRFVLQPLFFASIGFAIPFLELWSGELIWKGVVFAILMVGGKLIVGLCIPLRDIVTTVTMGEAGPETSPGFKGVLVSSWAPAALLGTAMVARGEIGLLIIQIGLNETPYLGTNAFVIAVWAIVLNTIIGPVFAGFLIKAVGQKIVEHPRWGALPEGGKRYVPERDLDCVGRSGVHGVPQSSSVCSVTSQTA